MFISFAAVAGAIGRRWRGTFAPIPSSADVSAATVGVGGGRVARRSSPVYVLGLMIFAGIGAGIAAPATVPVIAPAIDAAQAGMLDVATLAADIDVDIRYAGHDNFTGRSVPGYAAGKCLLLAPVAQALVRVQRAVRAQGYGLRIYDCYRPVRAVQAFVAWAHDLDAQATKAAHYPGLDKRLLLGNYIAEISGHSRGATVDLTLLDCRGGSCQPLDMGTDFDFFDPRAHTDSAQVSSRQRRHRQRLRQAMQAQGFVNYPMEWWHYTFSPEPTPHTAYDFPIR